MIWSNPWELFDGSYYVHPLYTSSVQYRPVWHAIQGAVGDA